MNKVGLVLNSSGAKGAYEAGVVKALIDACVKFDVICGASIGGLNAILTASNQIEDLVKVWEEKITTKSIFGLNPKLKLKFTCRDILLLFLPIISLFWIKKKLVKHIGELSSIGEPSLLRNLAKEIINIENLKTSGKKLILTSTNLQIGGKETFIKTENGKFFIKREDWIKEIKDIDFEKIVIGAVMATSVVPIAFTPEIILGYQYIDGGIGDITPLGNAISEGCSDIFTVLPKPPMRVPTDIQFTNFSSIGGRTLEIFLENIQEEDFKRVKLINQLILTWQKMLDGLDFVLKKVKEKEVAQQIQTIIEKSFPFKNIGRDKKLINTIIIQPSRDIDLSPFDFTPERLKKALRRGYQDACKKLDDLSDEKMEELEAKRLECIECKYEIGCEGKKIDSKFSLAIDRLIGKKDFDFN